LINWAEISEDNGNDVDSVADNGNQNTVGEQPPQLEDNQIDENGLDGGRRGRPRPGDGERGSGVRPGAAQDAGGWDRLRRFSRVRT
jgi:hypothetical protein